MSRRHALMLGTVCGLVCFLLLLATAVDIGMTWDEPIYSEAAERSAYWLWLVGRGDIRGAFDPTTFGISWGLVNEHPPLIRVLSGVGWALTRAFLPAPLTHRVGNMVLAACAIGVLAAATARRRGMAAGIFVGAAVLAMPRPFLHAHLAALDFALAAVWMMATLVFERVTRSPRRGGPLIVGLALGLALLTKINAVLLLPFWLIWLLLYRRTWRGLLVYLGSLPVALAVLIAGWPWIWKDPVSGLRNWVEFFRVHFGIPQWFAGQLYVNTPWSLPFIIVAITVPVTLLVLAVIGVLWNPHPQAASDGAHVAAGARRTNARFPSLPGSDWMGLHLLGMLTVLVYYALPFASIHDQDRLLLAAYFHLAALAGEGFAVVVAWLTGIIAGRRKAVGAITSPLGARMFAFGLGVLFLAPGFISIMRWHPFELSYYNELVGGAGGAQQLGMETAYFAGTYSHFLPELNRIPAGSKLWVAPNSWDVLYYYQRNGLLRDDVVLLRPSGWGSFYDDAGVRSEVGGLESADYALIERRQSSFNDSTPENSVQLEWAANKPVVARLERDGVLLAAMYSR